MTSRNDELISLNDDEGDQNLQMNNADSQESLPSLTDLFQHSTDVFEPSKQGLFKDICQTQLALWTFTVSVVSTYFWQKRMIPRNFIALVVAINAAACVSGVLFAVVVAAHLFNIDFFRKDEDSTDSRNGSRHLRANSICSYCSGHNSGASTPSAGSGFKGQAKFWQNRVSTERVYYYGSVIRR